jgi:hypothetical protein
MLDYILLGKNFISNLVFYKIFKEGILPIKSDHLPLVAEFQSVCTHQFLNRPDAKFQLGTRILWTQ